MMLQHQHKGSEARVKLEETWIWLLQHPACIQAHCNHHKEHHPRRDEPTRYYITLSWLQWAVAKREEPPMELGPPKAIHHNDKLSAYTGPAPKTVTFSDTGEIGVTHSSASWPRRCPCIHCCPTWAFKPEVSQPSTFPISFQHRGQRCPGQQLGVTMYIELTCFWRQWTRRKLGNNAC